MVDGTFPGNANRGSSALLVSACLLGVECNHRGAASPQDAVAKLAGRYRLIAICPEVAGGLPVPRPAAEIAPDGRVHTVGGDDVTDAYQVGAEVAVSLARTNQVVGAVLKARSPSCGTGPIYDGSFTQTLVDGEGVTAKALRSAGYEIVSEEDVAASVSPFAGA